jgi:hypothetical protein
VQRDHDVGRGDRFALQPRGADVGRALELAQGRIRLQARALEPRLVAFVLGALVALVDHLHAFLAGREGEAGEPQRFAARGALGRHEPLPGCHATLDVIEDQRRIHEHGAVVAHQRGRLHDRVDLAKLLEGAEDRRATGARRARP